MTPDASRPQALVADPIHADAVKALRARCHVTQDEVTPEALLASVAEYAVLIVRSRTKVTEKVIQAGKRLVVIARAGVGVDNIEVAAATDRGIPVVHAPAGSTQSVAELTVAHMLALARHLPQADRSLKAGRWDKKRFQGRELAGKVLGLVGSGRIGSEVARICQALGMTTIAYDPYLDEELAARDNIRLTTFEELLETSDLVSVHAALTEETRHLVGDAELARMKPSAVLVNCARGAIVDEAALVRALEEGRIAGAGLDVYEEEPPTDSPLLGMENVVLTPHIAASTVDAQRRTGLQTVEQVRKVLDGERPDFVVNPVVLDR